MPPITVMIKPVSGACNMRCHYCFYADEMKRREVAISPCMSDALLDVTVRRVIRSADSAVHFLFRGRAHADRPPFLSGSFSRQKLQHAPFA